MVRFKNIYVRIGWVGTVQMAALTAFWAYLIATRWSNLFTPILLGLIVLAFSLPLIFWSVLIHRVRAAMNILGHIQTIILAAVVLILLNVIPGSPLALMPIAFLTYLYIGTIFWVYSSPSLVTTQDAEYWKTLNARMATADQEREKPAAAE